MTIQELFALKRWQVANSSDRPIEFHTWDAMLTLWLMGWMGVPAALLLWQPWGVATCVILFFAPTLYVQLRVRLHDSQRVRCDWRHVVEGSMPEQHPSR